MKCNELAGLLLEHKDFYPLLQDGDKWVGIRGIAPTLAHKHAVTFVPSDPDCDSLDNPKLTTELLGLYRTFDILLRVGDDFAEITGVVATGKHRAAVTFSTAQPGLPGGGIIVVPPDIEGE